MKTKSRTLVSWLVAVLAVLFLGSPPAWERIWNDEKALATTIGALAGFGGIILTLIFNADQQRKAANAQEEAARRREEELEERERRVMVAGFRAELHNLWAKVSGLSSTIQERSEDGTNFEWLESTHMLDIPFYRYNAGRIGILDPELSQLIILSYGLYQQIPNVIAATIKSASPKRAQILQRLLESHAETFVRVLDILTDRPYLVKAGWAPNVLDMFSIEV